MRYVYLVMAIVAEVTATSFLTMADGFTKPVPSLVTLVGYAAAFYCLSQALRDIPTGVVYAIWSGLGIVLITAVAWLVQGQKLDTPATVGIALIIAGIAVMNLSSKIAPH